MQHTPRVIVSSHNVDTQEKRLIGTDGKRDPASEDDVYLDVVLDHIVDIPVAPETPDEESETVVKQYHLKKQEDADEKDMRRLIGIPVDVHIIHPGHLLEHHADHAVELALICERLVGAFQVLNSVAINGCGTDDFGVLECDHNPMVKFIVQPVDRNGFEVNNGVIPHDLLLSDLEISAVR